MQDKVISFSEFNVEMVNDLGGCEQAMKYLREKYGHQIDDLSNRRSDIITLIDEGKFSWVINFCMNLVTKEKQIEYIEYILKDILISIPEVEREVIELFYKCFIPHLKGVNYSDEILQIYEMMLNFNKELFKKESSTLNSYERYLFYRNKALMRLIDLFDTDLIKGCVVSSMQIISALICNCDIDNDTNKVLISEFKLLKEKDYGQYAMQLTGIWKND